MKKYIDTSFIYAILAMVFGVFYREYTKAIGFTGETRLSVMHTHYFALGMIMFLIIGLVASQVNFEAEKFGHSFFLLYNIGLNMTAIMLFVRGFMQANEKVLSKGMDAAISGIAGIGHLILGIGIIFFFLSTKKALTKTV